MLDHKTWKEDPELLGQISIDSDFITKSGFFLEEFGRHMVKAYQIAHKTGKKIRITLEYDPENKKSFISIRYDEQCNPLEG